MIAARLPSVAVVAAAFCVAGAGARADDAACQAVLQAVLKQTAAPVHQKVTIETAAAPDKPMHNEMIRLGDTLYMQVRGQWMARPYDAAKAAEDARQAMTKGEHNCTRVRSEAVDGQPAELYRVQSKTATGGSDSQIWISTASGLPLRQTVTMLEQGTVKLKHEVRSDYANIRAPAGVAR
ncbi:hypothetical protein [Reyranella soli]|jgi:hypothetical protein|uniref:Uncharacterized protein n=1 Tax=Reyranella soli TaxID=1230389 RepID=A0A512N4B2_9HYPH|nr:hypothetical protein [Reyranella soli]GEP53820.1 hypothetical protein RSO01_09860 [Reyranella soli]